MTDDQYQNELFERVRISSLEIDSLLAKLYSEKDRKRMIDALQETLFIIAGERMIKW